MKNIVFIFFMGTAAFTCLALKISGDFLQTLKIEKEDAENSVWYSFSDGYFNWPYSEVYHSIASLSRAALVKEIGEFAKTYTRSQSFADQYEEYRISRKPSAPEAPKSMQELKDEYSKGLQNSISEMEKNAADYSGDIRKGIDEAIVALKEQLKQVNDPNNPMYSAEMEEAMKQGYEIQVQDYNQRVEEWEQKYPVSSSGMIKQRLNYFLEISSTVDFNAKLVKSEYGQMVFVNEEYENKPSEWKMIFRAGKESTAAARTYAQQWLAEL